jgi:hypothetical protein
MRPRGRGAVVIVIAALLTPALADADDLGGATSASLAVIGSTDRPVVPTILMADCFCTSPWSSIDGTRPEFVGSNGWSTYGTWSVTGSQLRPPNNNTSDRLALYPSGVVDVAVESDVFRSNKNVQLGLVARSNGQLLSGVGMRRLQVVVASGRAQLTAWVGTSVVLLADVDASSLPNEYRLRMEVVGSDVRVSADGVPLIALTLPSPYDTLLASGTWVGLAASNAGNERLDNVLATTWPP